MDINKILFSEYEPCEFNYKRFLFFYVSKPWPHSIEHFEIYVSIHVCGDQITLNHRQDDITRQLTGINEAARSPIVVCGTS